MNATHALGWALLHFVWQGAALAILLGIGLAILPATAARARYALSLVTLGAMLILPITTGLRLYRPTPEAQPDATQYVVIPAPHIPETLQSPPSPPSPPSAPAPGIAAPTQVRARVARLREVLNPMLPWLVAAWVVGVVALSIRLGHGWVMARRLRTDGTRPTSGSLQLILSRLLARMQVRRAVELLESALVEVPAVIGWLRPVILVPASALTGLTPQQLEVLIAHELAHVRRYDYVVNVVQCVIETLLFYHPAVWWVTRHIRDEREHCCDDLVVQLGGDRHLYASALVDMERLRPAAPRLALAATGGGGRGSLLQRVTRLIRPVSAPTELVPRWGAGVAGILAVTVALLATGSDRLAGEPSPGRAAADTTRSAPDTVLRHPDPAQPLAQRWEWARTQARQLGRRAYWIGYQISRPEWLEHSVYIDRGLSVMGENITISGRLFGDFQGMMFRGVRLSPLTGTTDSDDIVILFGLSAGDQGARPTITHVHIASAYLPMHFRGRTLLWLGPASDAQSLPLVEGLFASTSQPKLREDIVSAVGIHGSSDAVVPILIRWLNGREATDVRAQAAEWIGFHPTPAAVSALSRAARTDHAQDVRREAAEALGDNILPAATDSAIAVARTAPDPEVRREAVEGLGDKTDARAQAALVDIAQNERDEDVQREAVETIGSSLPPARAISVLKDIVRNNPDPDIQREAVEALGEIETDPGNAASALIEFARSHPNSDVRREAVETIGELAPTDATVRLLTELATSDRSEDVQREAVETLGELGALGLSAVIEIARTHPHPDIRREAVETIGEQAPPAQAVDLLAQIARRDPNADVQREAVETLGEVHDERAHNLLAEFARRHPSSDVRREAIETLGETGRADSVMAILEEVARAADDVDAAREAVETLGELHDARALALVARLARSHASIDIRREAIETYAEAGHPDSAVVLFKSLLATDAPEDVYSEVLESLEELDGGVGIPVLIDAARSHPNREVRADALRRLAESDDPRAQQIFDQTLRRP